MGERIFAVTSSTDDVPYEMKGLLNRKTVKPKTNGNFNINLPIGISKNIKKPRHLYLLMIKKIIRHNFIPDRKWSKQNNETLFMNAKRRIIKMFKREKEKGKITTLFNKRKNIIDSERVCDGLTFCL